MKIRNIDSGKDEVVTSELGDPKYQILPEDWSPDGRYLTERRVVPDQIWIQPLFGERKPYPFATSGSDHGSRFSPDGKWIAYGSTESKRREIYVRSFPEGSDKIQVSTQGGERPAWSRDGKQLYFIALDGTLMAAPVLTGTKLEIGEPKELFSTGPPGPFSFNNGFDVTKDGRFLIPVRPEQGGNTAMNVVLNWTRALKK